MRSLLIYIATVFVAGALIAPWVYWLTQWTAGHFPTIQPLAAAPFHRYVNRSLLFVAVIGLWPFLISLRAVSWQTVGLARNHAQWRHFGAGFTLGFLTLLLVAVVAIAAGSRKLAPNLDADLATAIVGFAASGMAVALLEELLFRGVLFGALRREHPWILALLLSSAFYAAMHFFLRVKAPPDITWTSGFEQLARMAGGFIDPAALIPGFISLTLAGMALAVAYQRTGTLYLPLGLHAGWVFWLKALNAITVNGPEAKGPWGLPRNLYDSWLGLAVSAAALVAVCLLTRETSIPVRPCQTEVLSN